LHKVSNIERKPAPEKIRRSEYRLQRFDVVQTTERVLSGMVYKMKRKDRKQILEVHHREIRDYLQLSIAT
jgi:hypothetical protein